MYMFGQSKKGKTMSFPYPCMSGVGASRNEAKEGMGKEEYQYTLQKYKL